MRLIMWVVAAITLIASSGIARAGGDRIPLRLKTFNNGFVSPVEMVQDPNDPAIQYVVEKRGTIRVIRDGALMQDFYLDIRDRVSEAGGARGLFGLAFPPNYGQTGVFYLNYNRLDGHTNISRFHRLSSEPPMGDPDSEEVLITVEQPGSNHNSATMTFGPDGFMYIAMGDGGNVVGSRNGQKPDTLLGKILRIDVSTETGYLIPQDNPFVDGDPIEALHEIWAFGVRMPWRITFDDPARGGNGGMIIGDVGQNSWEEINYQPPNRGGRNYGWRNREGAHDYDNSFPPAYQPLIEPVLEWSHGTGRCAVAGFIYRGTELGSWYRGRFFFADYTASRLWSCKLVIGGDGEATTEDIVEHTTELGGPTGVGALVGFGLDAPGELYLIRLSGNIRRIALVDLPGIEPFAFTRVRGLPVSGVLADLFADDDQRLVTRPDVFRTSAVPPVQVQVSATAPAGAISRLRLHLELRASANNINGRVLLYNFNSSQYDLVHAEVCRTDDRSFTVTIDDQPGRYVSPGAREMRALLQFNALAFTIAPVWQVGLDVVMFEVEQ